LNSKISLLVISVLLLGSFSNMSNIAQADSDKDNSQSSNTKIPPKSQRPNFTPSNFDDHPFVPGELIVGFKPGVSESSIAAFYNSHQSDFGMTQKEDLDLDKRDNNPKEKLVTLSTTVDRLTIERLKQDPRVAFVEPNYIVSIDNTPNDPRFSDLWGLHNTGQTGGTVDADIDAPEAWDNATGSQSILVGIIDTGINYNHEDLSANIWTNPNEIPLNGMDDDNNGYIDDIHGINAITNTGDPLDDNGHGTHVSGTIGAVGNNGIGVTGVNWDVQLIGCKFLNSGGSGFTSNAIKCFNYFISLKNAGQNVLVTNNSWGGGGFSQALKDAMVGPILHVAASGNGNSDTDIIPHYPSSYDLENIVSIAATDHNDIYAGFSNYGATTVDLAAPGVGTLSTWVDGGYATISGTSMATPHVAGAAALVWSTNSSLTPVQVKDRIMINADPLPSQSKQTITNARLNVFNIVPGEDDPIPPSQVNDLSVSDTSFISVTLQWTATGDDGNVGIARAYDLRYSTSPIIESNWNAATRVIGEPPPQPPGSTETFEVDGLSLGTTYFFGIKVLDNVGNTSILSNIVSATPGADGIVAFSDDMESGSSNWVTSGIPGLWHLSNLRSNSSVTSWYYGQEITQDYETGAANSGNLTTLSTINLVENSEAVLTFYEWSEVETNPLFDRTRVQVSSDDVTWDTIFESHGTNNLWEKRQVNLSPYLGENISLRFWFDSVDNILNNFEGWYVDDVQIVTDSVDPCVAEGGDADQDGVCDASDNCINTPNAGQEDLDEDMVGDACDTLNEITKSKTLTSNHSVIGNVVVQNGILMTIPSGLTLTIPSSSNLLVQFGGGVLIEAGGTIILLGSDS